MKNRDVIKRLQNDVGVMEAPPISQAVRQAVREQRKKYIMYYGQAPEMERSTGNMVVRGIFAAMVTAIIVSVPMIVVMTNHASVSDGMNSREAVCAAESQTVTSAAEPETALERIKLQQVYGEVALSGKGEEELALLLTTYAKENRVYEDERYIYNFDPQGRLLEMRKAAFGDEEGSSVDEKTISSNVKTLLKEYYPDWLASECDIRLEKNEEARPTWTVDVIRKDHDLTKDRLSITFEKSGALHAIVRSGGQESIGSLSEAQAVQIAVGELTKGNYPILQFDSKNADITVHSKEVKNKLYYTVTVENIPYEIVNSEIYHAGFTFVIDAETGEFSLIDYNT